MTVRYDESKLDVKDISIPMADVIFKCSMHSKIWMAHLLYWVGLRSNHERLNEFLDSITDKRKAGTIGQYWNYAPTHFDPFLCVEEMQNFIHDNINTSRFKPTNTNYPIPPKNLINALYEVTLDNYKVICTQYTFLATGLKVGDRLMLYNNTFKRDCRNYSFYAKNVSSINLCAGCNEFKKKQIEKRSKWAYERYVAAEKKTFQQISSNIFNGSKNSKEQPLKMCTFDCGNKCAPGLTARGNAFDTCCRQCAVNKGKSINHDSHCVENNKVSVTMNNNISFKVLHSKDNEWKKDSTTTNCDICGKEFSFFKRMHHCRVCGDIICNKCMLFTSKNDMNVVKEVGTFEIVTVRMCKRCTDKPLQYCYGAEKKERQKWIYKGK